MANNKRYLCPMCGKALTHDEAYRHIQYLCPKRTTR